MRISRLTSLALVFVIAYVAVACNAIQPPARNTTAANFMPNLPDYNVVDTAAYRAQAANLLAAGAGATGQLQFAAGIKVADKIAGCFQNAGAYEVKAYINKTNPLASGIIAIVNKSVLTNPQAVIGCLNPANTGVQGAQAAIDPCAKTYEFNKDGNALLIAYAATGPQVCDAFCGNLEGCRAAQ